MPFITCNSSDFLPYENKLDVIHDVMATALQTVANTCVCVHVCMCVCQFVVPAHTVQLGHGGEHVEAVEEFEYLGSTISQVCSLDHEVDQ